MSDDIFEIFEELFEFRKRRRRGRDRDERPDTPPATPVLPPVFCMKCGARNEGGARFCLTCGEVLPGPGEEMRCPRCSSALPLTAKFCPRCGSPVA